MSPGYLIAWCIVALTGAAAMAAFSRRALPGQIALVAGQGLVFGMLLAAAATAISARADTAHAWTHAWPWLAAIGIAGLLVTAWLSRRTPRVHAPADELVENYPATLVATIALASLIWRGSLLVGEVLLRPTFPWDAWDAWAVKAKAWFLLGHYAPFVAPANWIARNDITLYTGPAWAYPSGLSWLQVWFASAAGDWIEPLVNLPWAALWLGLLLGHYGQWRALGLARTRALVFVYVLGSLPLLETHVALAGYADLWVGTVFGFGILAWLRWQEQGDRAQLVLALICASILPLLKLEGSVWSISLVMAIAFGALPTRWRWRAAALAAALAILIVLVGQSYVLFAAIGWVKSGSRVVDIPVIGTLALAWHGTAALGIAHSLFVQANWHVLWWLVLPIAIWRWRALRASDALSLCALLLGLCFSLLMFLFLFTDAAEWAESFTAINRLVMHIVPGVVTLLALLLRGPVLPSESPDRTPAPARLPDPA